MSNVFVSYSRKDSDTVTAIVKALRDAGQDVWVDEDKIVPSTQWMEEIKTAIANADSVIFVISPDSVASDVCRTELQYAVDLPKRIVPVVIRGTPVEAVPAPLPDIDWAFVRQDSFDADIAELVEALETDIDRVHLHTRLLVQATDWETRGGNKSLLLRGAHLAEAERWLTGQTDQKPPTTPAQAQFIGASRRAVNRRQRGTVVGAVAVSVILAVIAAVAVVGFTQANAARHQAQDRFRQATAQRLTSEAADLLAETTSGGDARAFEELLAARTLVGKPDEGALFHAVAIRATTLKIIDTGTNNYGVVFSPDGHRLASASADHTVRVWNADTGQPIGTPLTGHTDAVASVAFSPDGHRIVSGSVDKTVRLWNADTGQPIGAPLHGHTGAVASVAFSPDGHRLASASADQTVRIWNADTGQPIGAPLTGHTGHVISVAFSPDGHRLASGGDDQTVRIWNADTGQPIGAPLTDHTNTVFSVVFSPDGHRLASASGDQTVRVWNADTGRPIGALLTGHTSTVWAVVFSPDGHRLASASDDHTVRVWNADTGQPIGPPLEGHTGRVWDVVFSPDGHRLASASSDQTVRVWNADTGQPIGQPLTGHIDEVTSVAFSPDGHRLASGSTDDTVRVWNADTGQPIGQPLTGHTGAVRAVIFSPDGRRLASASDDHTIQIWNADTGQPIGARLTGHTNTVWDVVFSPDGHRLASAGGDHTVRVWNADTGQPIGAPLSGHTDTVTRVAFSPDGHRLASASTDRSVRVWNADTGQPIGAPLTAHTNWVWSVVFSPDGRQLASASADHTVRLWPAVASPADLCDKLTANMSRRQWHDWVSPDIDYEIQCPGLPVPADIATLGVEVSNDPSVHGAKILATTEGGPAATTGLPNGAVVTKFDDRVIDSADALVAAVRSKAPGDTVTLTYIDPSGTTRTVQVTLGSAQQ